MAELKDGRGTSKWSRLERREKSFEIDSEANSEPLKGGLANPNIKNTVVVGTSCNKDM